MARLLVTTGGGEFEATVAMYHKIVTYALMAEPKIEYPATSKEISTDARNSLKSCSNRIRRIALVAVVVALKSSKSTPSSGHQLCGPRDTSVMSPSKECNTIVKETTALCGKLGFDAPSYVSENRWCEDWDFTCTVGVTATPDGVARKGQEGQTPAGSGLAAVLDAKSKG